MSPSPLPFCPPSACRRAITRSKGLDALQEVIALGKKGRVSKRTSTAAYTAHMKCMKG